MVLGWWVLIPTLVIVGLFLVFGDKRRWQTPWGWALCILGIGLMIADGFKSWTPVSIGLLIVGGTLGFNGILNGENSPVK